MNTNQAIEQIGDFAKEGLSRVESLRKALEACEVGNSKDYERANNVFAEDGKCDHKCHLCPLTLPKQAGAGNYSCYSKQEAWDRSLLWLRGYSLSQSTI